MSKPIYVSPSQVSSFLLCPRLYHGDKIRRLPREDKGHGHFGTCLHGVVERFLLSDDNGRDPKTGEIVDLYPKGWDIARNKFNGKIEGYVNRAEQLQIRRLFDIAVSDGHLKRWPGRRIEVPMKRPVIPGVETWAYIDVLLPGAVIDHKSTKNMRYAKSPNALRDDPQLLFYAWEVLLQQPNIEEITISHIYYCKDPNSKVQVKTVPVLLHRDEVAEGWAWIQDTVRSMLSLRELGPDHPWFDVPGPVSYAKSCNAYGGCSFRPICGRKESIFRYTDRVNRLKAQPIVPPPEPAPQRTIKEAMSSLFDEIMSDDEAPAKGNATKPKAKAAAKPAAKAAKETKSEGLVNGKIKVHEAPPWAVDGCPACTGVGFNSRGEPCKICVGRSSKSGAPNPKDFTIETDDDGYIVWEPNGDVDETEAGEEQDEVPEDDGEQDEEPAPPPKGTKRVKAADLDTKSPGRPSKAADAQPFLYLRSLPVGIETTRIVDIFEDVSGQLAKAAKQPSFYSLDVWDRRAQFQKVGAKLAEQHAGEHIDCNSADPDVQALVSAMEPHCVVVRGLA